ncbi:HNH endonuclease signature motif containing protein [Serratia fonticola]|uniref:HNH endonuclease signature motif containing protein n=1 Tax=Serratia fonticola TaxID=47917 RepID=UPI00217AC848|nr:HNH endonuclease signature motif containing protein [Serratia fonticola]CAI1942150.1 Uncharacterised protein [Serratia fonticola]
MSRFIGNHYLNPLHNAAIHWKNECLLKNGSVFSHRRLWTMKNIKIIFDLFVNNPDEGDSNFFDKLQLQLGTRYPDVICLAAEMIWLLSLPSTNVSRKTKINNITRVWEWSGQRIDKDGEFLSDTTLAGFANTGVSYNTNRWREMSYLIEIVRDIFLMTQSEREKILSNGWELAIWIEKNPNSRHRQFRHIILFLLFPDFFERIASGIHRLKIVSAFDNINIDSLRKMKLYEIDKKLFDVRKRMEISIGTTQIDFYLPPLVSLWRTEKDDGIGLTAKIIKEEEDRLKDITEDKHISKVTKKQIIESRIGHGKYRINLSKIEGGCRITQVSDKSFLTASHIKPWRACKSQNECLDGNNGLWLAPHIDRLFDHGWISFDDKGYLIYSNEGVEKTLARWNIIPPINIGKLNEQQQLYMTYHRDHIYHQGCFYKK